MQIISTCTILFILILNMLCTGQENNDWNITFNPPEVTAVAGLCVLISCTFTYPDEAKPSNVLWNECNKIGKCGEIFNLNGTKEKVNGIKVEKENIKPGRIEMLEPDLTKNNCSIIMKNITPSDKKYYMLRLEESGRKTYNLTVKITIQDEPKMEVPLLREGQEANLTCSAPFPCPESPPEITWWIKTRKENITYLKDNIILTNSKRLYLSTLTLTPTSDLHNATVTCEVSYGSKNINTSRTLKVMCQVNNDWNITFNPPEVTAVAGLCVLISCTFTYPDEAKPSNVLWNECNKKGKCSEIFNLRYVTEEKVNGTKEKKNIKSGRIKMLEPVLTKNNCSIIMKNITPSDKKEYMLRLEESGRNTYNLTVKITIQDEPKMEVPLLREGQEANLTCSAPFPCPESPPEITWWIKTREGNITDLKDNIILSNSKSLYLSMLTLTPTSDLHNATVTCEVSYGSKNISTSRTLEVM
ncbi:hypothetical protein cypCar_00043816 [Cyprinus carpio]|nr:hypothetical protein cypCar_00043816 [Cyprinus carpio]